MPAYWNFIVAEVHDLSIFFFLMRPMSCILFFFLQLYQEQLYDLLSGRPRDNSVLDIREDTRGICIPNLTEIPITSASQTFDYLLQVSFYFLK